VLLELWQAIAFLVVSIGVGFIVGTTVRRHVGKRRLEEAQHKAQSLIKDAEQQARATSKEAELSAKDMQLRAR